MSRSTGLMSTIFRYFILFTFVSAKTYYITRTSNITCSSENVTCLTLTEYAQHCLESRIFPASITLIFEAGNHDLGLNLRVSNSSTLILRVAETNYSSHPLAVVRCNGPGFNIESISEVYVSGLEFNGCTKNNITLADQLRLERCKFHTGHGIILYGIKKAIIERSSFSSIKLLRLNSNLFLGGGAITAHYSNVVINGCQFNRNTGGLICFRYSNVEINMSVFTGNHHPAGYKGGAIIQIIGFGNVHVVINGCQFNRNTGSLIYSRFSNVEINMSVFTGNRNPARYKVGAIININGFGRLARSLIILNGSAFITNTVQWQGYIIEGNSANIIVCNSTFINNSAISGGVFETAYSNIIIYSSTYTNNMAKYDGGVILATQREKAIITIHNSTFTSNRAGSKGGVIAAVNVNITIHNSTFNNNRGDRGGIIWANQSTITSHGFLQITNNRAREGIVYASNSILALNGNSTLANNYENTLFPFISQTDIVFDGYTNYNFTINHKAHVRVLDGNTPPARGIVFRGTVDFTYNQLYSYNRPKTTELQSMNKIYIFVFPDSTIYIPTSRNTALFSGDRCIYHSVFNTENDSETNITTNGNTVVDKGEGVYSFVVSSKLQLTRIISSEQIHLCFCEKEQPNCNQPPPTINVKKGQIFSVALAAIDQNGNLIPHTVSAFLLSRNGRLGEGQAIQSTDFTCKKFNYTISSPHGSEQLALNAYGPCNNIEISQIQINVEFFPCYCPTGFNVKSEEVSNCVCECDSKIHPQHITSCSFANNSVQRRDNNWINYINTSDQEGYVIHPHCPFDYCRPSTEQVWIDLNVPNGADEQCAFNRSGKLCGTCKDGLSHSLGSSRCLPCSNNWLALLIVFAIAGVALVAFLLVCNLTVAVGTINGLIFYANILTTNRATFFPFETHNFFTVFIAWLNLDFGFETCFYERMDGYAKEWLQLVFPLYIIFMVAMVIIACEYTTRIARVFTNTNPVATLATLILLSYTKSLRLIIAALSSTTLEYPDGSSEMVWLTDASIHYFEGKHIPLLLVALLILLVGIAYTLFLFYYQWILPCSYGRLRALKWIKSARFYPFMDAYHAPYNKKHRYWTALLLFVRAFLYVAVSLNVSGNPSINLLVIICTVLALRILKMLLPARVYKSWLLDVLENSFIFNLLIFSVATLYIRETGGNQAALAYISTSIAFTTFLIILLYHTYANILSKKLRNKLDSIKLKVLTDELQDRNHDTYHVKQIPENKCTYSIVDPIPSLSKTIAEIEAHNKAQTIMEGETKEHNCSSYEISVAHANRQNTEHQEDIELDKTAPAFNKTDSSDEPNSTANDNDRQCIHPTISNTLFVDPYIADIDQRGVDRETEINEIIEITQ